MATQLTASVQAFSFLAPAIPEQSAGTPWPGLAMAAERRRSKEGARQGEVPRWRWPHLIPGGSLPGHTRREETPLAAREATRRRREVAVWRREVTAWRRSTSSTATTATATAAFSPIPPTPLRVGEGEPPPSWDPVPTPIGKQRVDWNPTLEKSLVEILHEYKDSGYRSDNGWNTEGWNKMVKEFHLRNKSVSYTKAQIQDKECQLKRDYKMLKAARMQSGSKWNEQRNMVEGSASMWENLIVTFPKIKKFQNNKASFPLFDALGELYDGHLAEGTYNFTSIESERVEEPLQQIDVVEEEAEEEAL
ncbi:uncharacterized protein LOC101752587 [Setaria italica]|uniref:uncharacterized protein LOC101752587 n=1 Tax=Setaria italica TaxID=4555 RepID=UPI0006479B8A|nr:uncharacterized protein LOC101752587 [Setaria italica]